MHRSQQNLSQNQHLVLSCFHTNSPFAELPWQNPILISDIIHCTAPSPIVYPDVLLLEQRQSSSGFGEQVPSGKLASKNEMKHSCAHVGMKFVSSGVRVKFAFEAAALACIENPNIRRIRLGQHNAILIGAVERNRQHTLMADRLALSAVTGSTVFEESDRGVLGYRTALNLNLNIASGIRFHQAALMCDETSGDIWENESGN